MVEKTIGYRKIYKMRRLVPNRMHISVALPPEVVEREAASRGLSVDDFIIQFVVMAEYDNFDGVRYTFQETGNDNCKGS